ncbi:MAG: NAD-binding protein [Acidobacteriota bacterium]|nr:NAD-binding protein [Blastocatellia bacterium]MDW8411642.1 NAD-binding protein [Acidobacteriota bacterium]
MNLYEEEYFERKLLKVGAVVLFISVVGVSGYVVIEDWPLLDAIYMTVITLSTIGYGETHPLSPAGRIFTVFLILTGLGIIGYGLSIFAAFIVDGQLGRVIKRHRMEQKLRALSKHYIICGAGETGRCVAEEFIKTKKPFVVIEKRRDAIERIDYRDLCYIIGDATRDAVLQQAGIERAVGLISALDTDRDNLFVVLTARALNSKMKIVSRLVDQESEKKLLTAGADSVVSPNRIGGMRMASVMLRPTVVSFLDLMLQREDKTLRIEEVTLQVGSPLLGKSLAQSEIKNETGLIVIAVRKRAEQHYIYNPSSEVLLEEGDTLIVIGDISQAAALKQLAGDNGLDKKTKLSHYPGF